VARIDDYKESFRIAAEALGKADPHRLANLAAAEISVRDDGIVEMRLPFLGAPFVVSLSGDAVDVARDGEEGEVPLPEKILICHYLLHASGEPPTGELITFRQIPDGHFYFDAFQRRARDPFLATFGHDADLFRECARALGGQPSDAGDAAMSFQVLPRISIGLVLWQGDDELPSEASVLFDSSIRNYLAVEDIAVVSGMLVYRLMGIARSRTGKDGPVGPA
jgi:hypothetical protein